MRSAVAGVESLVWGKWDLRAGMDKPVIRQAIAARSIGEDGKELCARPVQTIRTHHAGAMKGQTAHIVLSGR